MAKDKYPLSARALDGKSYDCAAAVPRHYKEQLVEYYGDDDPQGEDPGDVERV
jgi:hypothetical protein